MKIYLELENDLFSKIEKNTVRAATSAAASMKCRQVANGGIYLDQEVRALVKLPKSEREWLDLHYLKTDAVEELVEELQGSPLLVAYDFNHDLARLQERFGKDVPNIGSGVSPKKSKVIEDAWNRGELPHAACAPTVCRPWLEPAGVWLPCGMAQHDLRLGSVRSADSTASSQWPEVQADLRPQHYGKWHCG
jgi:hypothetical protein